MRNLTYNRYKNGILVLDPGGKWVIPNPAGFDTRPRPDDRFHTMRDGERLDLLAHKYFRDARLYWVICLYNDIFWFLDADKLKAGTVLRLPSSDTLIMDLLE